jgi:hypothetical protein
MFGVVTCNGKIIRRKCKGYTALNFLLVKNIRSELTGRPTYKVLHNFGTIRSTEVAIKAKGFWIRVEIVLRQFVADKTISSHDGAKVRKQFSRVIPVPTASPIPAPAPTATPKKKDDIAQRLERFKGWV